MGARRADALRLPPPLASVPARDAGGTGLRLPHLPRRRTQLVGGLSISNVRRGVAQAASIGYWIGAPYVGRGHMTDAVKAVLPFAFVTLGSAPAGGGVPAAQLPLRARAAEGRLQARRHGAPLSARSTASGRTTISSPCCKTMRGPSRGVGWQELDANARQGRDTEHGARGSPPRALALVCLVQCSSWPRPAAHRAQGDRHRQRSRPHRDHRLGEAYEARGDALQIETAPGRRRHQRSHVGAGGDARHQSRTGSCSR